MLRYCPGCRRLELKGQFPNDSELCVVCQDLFVEPEVDAEAGARLDELITSKALKCRGCKRMLPEREFAPSKRSKSGFRSKCRSCESAT